MNPGDTIVAISSATGSAARMIVRMSGPGARQIRAQLAPDASFDAGAAAKTSLRMKGLLVPAWMYSFVAPHSYTGEDLAEFHLPGNPLLARMVLDEAVHLGARHAEPGEFTARAFFNGRIDLAAAEGVAATIAASSERELRAARQLRAGELARRLRPIIDLLADSLALVEVGIDFTEEDVTFLSAQQLRDHLLRCTRALQHLLDDSSRIETLVHEPTVVLVGRPNAGKSTLLNALAGEERAVVSPHAGTTRDAIWSHAILRRGIVRILDVAGIDQSEKLPNRAPTTVHAEIERKMREAAVRTVEAADIVVLLRDSTDQRPDPQLPRQPDLIVLTKLDLAPHAHPQQSHALAISALLGTNLELLRERLDLLAFGAAPGGGKLALNARHVHAIADAQAALDRALVLVDHGGAEVIALELRESLDALGSVLGVVTPDDLLGRIFGQFCIGK